VDSTPPPSNGKAGTPFVWVPETLDLDGLIPSEGVRVAEGVLWLGHCVLVGLAHNARYRDDGRKMPLQATYLRNVIGRHHLDKVREAAERIGYVRRGPSYERGKRSQRYWLLEPHATARAVKREITHPGLLRNIRKWREARQRETWKRIRRNETPVAAEVCEHLWRHLQRLRIDDEIDFGEDSKPAHQIAVDHIRRREFRFSVDDFGRVHTNVTNLRKVLRRHLSVDGKRLSNIDTNESQPLFVGLALAKAAGGRERGKGQEGQRGRKAGGPTLMLDSVMLDKQTALDWKLERGRLPGDLRAYLALCEQRGLYLAVADRLGLTGDDGKDPRDEAKKRVFVVFFDKPWHRNRTYRVLAELFPSVIRSIGEMKGGDHRRLAHFAQRIESAFMYGQVVPRIIRERPGLFISTIHDSVLTPVVEERYVQDVMRSEFAKLGVSPQVKIERC